MCHINNLVLNVLVLDEIVVIMCLFSLGTKCALQRYPHHPQIEINIILCTFS